jgi:hypothetical protein
VDKIGARYRKITNGGGTHNDRRWPPIGLLTR